MVVVGVAVAAPGVLHLYHRQRLDLPSLDRAVQERTERARRLQASLAGFDARRALRSLEPNPRNGPVIRLDERLAEARVSPPPEALPAGRPRLAVEYEDGDELRLLPVHENWSIEDGILTVTGPRAALLSSTELDLAPEDVAELEIRIRLRRGSSFHLGWSAVWARSWPNREQKARTGRLKVHTREDGEFHVYRVDLRQALKYKLEPADRIRSLLLFPSDVDGDDVEIDYVRLWSLREFYARRPVGHAHETIGEETRSVIHAVTPRELRWEVQVPPEHPELGVGLGVLEAGSPALFSIRVADGHGSEEVLERRVGRVDGWDDVRVDLGRWAGRQVTVTLSASSAEENVALWSNPRIQGRRQTPLHILVILEDTLRADHLSLYGYPRETSPVKDRLARRGVVFDYAFSQATKTRPSCPTLMTSLLPSATGVWGFVHRLEDSYLTLPEILRSQGWETASFIQNTNAGPAAGLQQGFSYLWGPSVMGSRPEQLYGERVLRWLARHRDRNIFAYVHLLDPHGIYDPPPPFDAFYRERGPGSQAVKPRRNLDAKWIEEPTAEGRVLLYDGEIRHNDARLEPFLSELDRTGMLDDTLLVFLSDHGEHLGEHGLWQHKPPAHRQVVHVPLVMIHPQLVPSGRRVSQPVELADVAPTILELAGIPVRGLPLLGRSLVPLWRDGGEKESPRLAVAEEAMGFVPGRDDRIRTSFFFDRWHVMRTERDGRMELQVFDYRSDPAEQRPLASVDLDLLFRRKTTRLMRGLSESHVAIWREFSGDATAADVPIDPASQEQLRALGYLE